MSTHIFLDKAGRSRVIRPAHFAAHIRRVVSGANDSIEALKAFKSLIDGFDTQHSFLDFDSHCGDCACQLRPVALHQIITLAEQEPELFCADLVWTISRIQKLHDEALRVHRLLCDEGWSMEKLVGKQLPKNGFTRGEYYAAIGLQDWFDDLDRGAATYTAAAMNSIESTSTSGAETPLEDTLSNSFPAPKAGVSLLSLTKEFELDRIDEAILYKQEQDDAVKFFPSGTDNTFNVRLQESLDREKRKVVPMAGSVISNVIASSSTNASSHHASKVDNKSSTPTWDVYDWFTVVQFLVFSYTLGRYKQVVFQPGFSAFIYRLSPQIALEKYQERDEEELACRHKKGKGRCPWRRGDDAAWSTIDAEFNAMQAWMSQTSTRLVESLATSRNLPPSLEDVAHETLRQGPRAIAAIPTFLTFVPVRQYWFDARVPLFLIVQRFCSEGYHLNYFRVTPSGYTCEDDVPARTYTFDCADGADDDGEWQHEMHACTIANSMVDTESGAQDLIRIKTSSHSRSKPHKVDCCPDNTEFRKRIMNSDFDDIYLTFFAQHCDYPFAVKGVPVSTANTSPSEPVETVDPLRHSFSSNGLAHWATWQAELVRKSRNIGSSYESMSLCVPEHMFADVPNHIKRVLSTRWEKEEPVILPGFMQSIELPA